MSVGWFLRMLAALGAIWLLTSADCQAAGRRKVVERTDLSPAALLPAASAPAVLAAPILSGLDYTAVAPPGTRLRVIEDEPYIYVFGRRSARRFPEPAGASFIQLRGSQETGGNYRANLSLRYMPGKSSENVLQLAFDTAAHYTYMHTLAVDEQRGELVYALSEVRSPLGLTKPRDQDNHQREYLAYSAAVVNPQGAHLLAAQLSADGHEAQSRELGAVAQLANQLDAASSEAAAAEDTAADSVHMTPYLSVAGQLKTLRRLQGGYCLLTIDFSAQGFSHSLTLTENIARCIINRLDSLADGESRLDYLAYYPEYEPFIPYFDGEIPDAAVADLAERPGEGCGSGLLPISGDVCPRCGERQGAPAAPYSTAAAEFAALDSDFGVCSHCLFGLNEGLADTASQLQSTGPGGSGGCQTWRGAGKNKCRPSRSACQPAGACRGRDSCHCKCAAAG